jgi:hypothetical protein
MRAADERPRSWTHWPILADRHLCLVPELLLQGECIYINVTWVWSDEAGNLPCPYPLHVCYREVACAHAGHLRVGVGLARLGALDHLEEVLDLTTDASPLRQRR